MKSLKLAHLLLMLVISVKAFASGNPTPAVRDITQYNLEANSLALQGYDPVSYFSEGGGLATAGSTEITLTYKQVNYRFVDEKNMKTFLSKPNKYEATYGNWCAFAMASNQKVNIDPEVFTVNGNRLHFFISAEAKAMFDANVAAFERRADINWKRISGENPRK